MYKSFTACRVRVEEKEMKGYFEDFKATASYFSSPFSFCVHILVCRANIFFL